MRASRIAFAAIIIAAAACTDSTLPASPDSLAAARIIKNPKATTTASSVPASLYSGYSMRSPHWQHITTMMTDFYFGWTTSERA
ncbi:MAG: hypothetical protein M3Y05_15430 [Gemmatimonadota bacterium]|nr:hypothetical protein [Gemmatimonadota bacterium]